MDESEISSYLLPRIGSKFKGTFPKYVLPKNRDNGGYIINTSCHEEPGTHWIGIVVTSEVILLLDSLNIPIFEDYFSVRFLTYFNRSLLCKNMVRYQSQYSSVCGYYACVFLDYVKDRISFKEFLELFHTSNYDKVNDLLITRMFYDK